MSDLRRRLDGLGLSQYFEALVSEGFDTWDVLCDITEEDLTALNVKLGHRRKLQRAIAGFRASSQPDADTQAAGATNVKRKYRRHPKADDNAPPKPNSAYVIFSNVVREELKAQSFTFPELAKIVGQRWRDCDSEQRKEFEAQAAAARSSYNTAFEQYKLTHEYETYQLYLEEWNAKHGPQTAEGKRSKVESEPSPSSSGANTSIESGLRQSLPSDPPSPYTFTPGGGRGQSSMARSPAGYSLSSLSSPRMLEHASPAPVSPLSAPLLREGSHIHDPHGTRPGPSGHQFGDAYFEIPHAPSSSIHPGLKKAISAPEHSFPQQMAVMHRHGQPSQHEVLDRSASDSVSLPRLNRPGPLQFAADHPGQQGSFYQPYQQPSLPLPTLDPPAQRSHRVLPQPVAGASGTSGIRQQPQQQHQQSASTTEHSGFRKHPSRASHIRRDSDEDLDDDYMDG